MPVAATQTQGLLDTWGGKFVDVIDWNGPTSYVAGAAGGEPIPATAFGCFNNLLFIEGSISVSGTYYVNLQPVNVGGYTTWRLRWFVVATALEVANAVNLSAETVKLWGFGV